jgi:glycosyltransferase involved in cell wall biosynthesis
LRIAHLGRLDPVKGTEILVKAVRALPDLPIELDIFGVLQSSTDQDVRDRVASLIGSDARIRVLAPVPHSEVIARLAEYDIVAVPSQWMETGPLVVLEAFAAGVPVIGSALGGIADKVADGVNGILVRPSDSVLSWTAALKRLEQDRGLLGRLAAGIPTVRRAGDMADDMLRLYSSLLSPSRQPAQAGHTNRERVGPAAEPVGAR